METPGLGIPNHADGGHTEDATRGSCDAFVGGRRALVTHNPAVGRHIPDRRAPGSSARRIRGVPKQSLKRDAPDTARASSDGSKPTGRPGIGGVDGRIRNPFNEPNLPGRYWRSSFYRRCRYARCRGLEIDIHQVFAVMRATPFPSMYPEWGRS